MSGLLSARPAASIAGLLYYATDMGLLYRDTGAAWVTVAANDLFSEFIYYISGAYYGPAAANDNAGGAATNGELRGTPFQLHKRTTFDRIGINHYSTTGSAGAVERLGIYRVDSDTLWTLILDAGTVATDTAAARKEITISQLLERGLYYLVGVGQGAPATVPNIARVVRQISGTNPFPWFIPRGNNANFTLVPTSFQRTGITGALPGTLTIARADFENVAEPPYIWMRAT